MVSTEQDFIHPRKNFAVTIMGIKNLPKQIIHYKPGSKRKAREGCRLIATEVKTELKKGD